MPKWIDEKVLQRYWIDCCNKYEVNDVKIVSAEFNSPFDRYPDVNNRLEDGTTVPAEIEWKTSDFNHDIDVLKKQDGFLKVTKTGRTEFRLLETMRFTIIITLTFGLYYLIAPLSFLSGLPFIFNMYLYSASMIFLTVALFCYFTFKTFRPLPPSNDEL